MVMYSSANIVLHPEPPMLYHFAIFFWEKKIISINSSSNSEKPFTGRGISLLAYEEAILVKIQINPN